MGDMRLQERQYNHRDGLAPIEVPSRTHAHASEVARSARMEHCVKNMHSFPGSLA